MGWSCRRPGCSGGAQVAITYDAVACQVWLDPLDAAPGGAQPLCAEHAARLSPPRGWVVLDRRDSQASLMTISPPIVEQAGRPAVGRRRFPRRWGQFDEPRLEFVGPEDSLNAMGSAAVDVERVDPDRPVPAVPIPAVPIPAVPNPEQPEPVADTVESDSAPVAASTGSPPERDPEAAEPEPGPARFPVRRAATAELLKPKGRLLSRAFDLTGDQHSALTGASGVTGDPERPGAPIAASDSDGE